MTDEITGGAAAKSASHWAAKSGGVASPASGGTGGPHWARKSRTRVSCAGSRRGGGSGIHRLSWTGLLLPARNSSIQAAIPSGVCSSSPAAPMPPAWATAIESDGGQAPAIGASRIGTFSPKRSQNAAVRDNDETMLTEAPERLY